MALKNITILKIIFILQLIFILTLNATAGGIAEAYCNSFVPATINLSQSMRQAGAPIGMVDNSIMDWNIEDVNMRIFLKQSVARKVYKNPNNINQYNLIQDCIAFTRGY